MPTTITCPACGAPLEIDPGKKIVRCKFCSNDVSVPEAGGGEALSGVLPAGLNLPDLMRLKAVKELARQGRANEAARIYQQITRCTPEEARRAIEAISAGQPVVLSSTSITEQADGGDPTEVIVEIEDLFRGQSDPRARAVEDLLRELLD